MKADKDDAPEYLRRKRSQSFGKWSLAIALGLGLSGLALHMVGNKLSFLPKPQPSQPARLEKPAHTPNDNTPQNQPQKTSEELFWESVNARDHQQSQPKDAPINLSCSRGKLQFSRHLQRHWTKSDRKIMYGELFR
ncbi:hypothetical protein ACRCRM_33890, partial [Pseudomonas aeruginosa]